MKNNQQDWLQALQKISSSDKISRIKKNPWAYLIAMTIKKIYFPLFRTSFPIKAKTFFGVKMNTELPSATDIYLTGGKTHDSEIRFSKYLVKNLKKGQCFVDTGAHFGFYSLLGAILTGKEGRILAIEASPKTFEILEKNTRNYSQIIALPLAASATNQTMDFYEYKGPYSEFNSYVKSTKVGKKFQAGLIQIQGQSLSSIFQEHQLAPDFIKIDVEGSEDLVITGLCPYLENLKPIIILEYHPEPAHRRAVTILLENNYQLHLIDQDGNPQPVEKPHQFLTEKKETSDNILFLPL
jgi:FkbM family methyltransferase